jgi:simple sugar transport system permease protein
MAHEEPVERPMIDFLIAIARYSTPVIYVTLAGVLAARAGVWHLGLEGLMIVGAGATVLGYAISGSLAAGLGIAMVICIVGSCILWFVIERLRANPIIAGLGLTGLGLSSSDLATQVAYGSQGAVRAPTGLPRLGTFVGTIAGPFSVLSILVVLVPVVVAGVWFVTKRTRWGLQLSATGEHPFAARSVGVDTSRMRLLSLCAGGVLCALGGAELALGSLQVFANGMTSGRGFMAFSAVIFGGADPLWSVLVALFFAAVGALGIKAQLLVGAMVPSELLLALPYLATVIGVTVSGATSHRRLPQTTELRDF